MDECIKVVDDYVLSTPDKQYRKNPDTYLRNKCWEDEIIIKTPIENIKKLSPL